MDTIEGVDTTDWTSDEAVLTPIDAPMDELFLDDETGVVDNFPPSW